MHAATHHLASVLTDYLRRGGATIRYATLDADNTDARWHAATRTLTLRADADPTTHLEIIRDLIGMITLGYPSQLGAIPHRHLHAVAG